MWPAVKQGIISIRMTAGIRWPHPYVQRQRYSDRNMLRRDPQTQVLSIHHYPSPSGATQNVSPLQGIWCLSCVVLWVESPRVPALAEQAVEENRKEKKAVS